MPHLGIYDTQRRQDFNGRKDQTSDPTPVSGTFPDVVNPQSGNTTQNSQQNKAGSDAMAMRHTERKVDLQLHDTRSGLVIVSMISARV